MSLSNSTVYEKQKQAANAIMEFMDRTGYTVFLINGQRITQIENPGKEFQIPADGCEVYFSHFPKDAYEDKLFPLFSKYGKILQMRLLMHFSGLPKGYGYAVYETKSQANQAVSELNGLIMNSSVMRVCKSFNNKRLFVTGIPNDYNTNRMESIITNIIDEVTKVAYFKSHKPGINNSYCFVDFKSHQAAIKSKSVLRFNLSYELKTNVRISWARPEVEVDEKDLAEVKTMFVRGSERKFLDRDAIASAVATVIPKEEVMLIKTIRHFSFIRFKSRAATEEAIEALKGKIIGGQELETALARPLKWKFGVNHPLCMDMKTVSAGKTILSSSFPNVRKKN